MTCCDVPVPFFHRKAGYSRPGLAGEDGCTYHRRVCTVLISIQNNAVLLVQNNQIMLRTRSSDHSVVRTDNHFYLKHIFKIVFQHSLPTT